MNSVVETILADDLRRTTKDDIRQAIQQRATRGMLTYNTGKVHRLEGELWAVPSTRGGFHQVDLAEEVCDCEDFTFYGRDHGIGCRHIYAAAIANASRRSGIRIRTISAAGDGLAYAAKKKRRAALALATISSLCADCKAEEAGQGHHGELCCKCAKTEGVL
jgi:hypothetical protein